MDAISTPLISSAALRPLDTPTFEGTSPEEGAKRFQALLATLLVKEMRRGLADGFFGSGPEGDVYGGWLDQHVGESLAARNALHLESALSESLARKARQAQETS